MKKILPLFACTLLLFSYSSKAKTETETSATPEYVKEFNAGVAAQQRENYQEAIEYYQQALSKKSDFADAWNNLGYCYRMTAKSYLARSGHAYDKALSANPKLEEALEYQGEYFVMVGQLDKAYSNYQTLQTMHSKEADELKSALDAILKQAQSVLKTYAP
jgi:tetratricopeptide (TPR) repeat protein